MALPTAKFCPPVSVSSSISFHQKHHLTPPDHKHLHQNQLTQIPLVLTIFSTISASLWQALPQYLQQYYVAWSSVGNQYIEDQVSSQSDQTSLPYPGTHMLTFSYFQDYLIGRYHQKRRSMWEHLRMCCYARQPDAVTSQFFSDGSVILSLEGGGAVSYEALGHYS